MNRQTPPMAPASRALPPFLTLALLLPSAPLAAQEPTPIAFGVPRDVHLFVHGRTTQTPDPGYVKLERACARLIESGIHDDVIDLLTLEMRPAERQRTRAAIDRALGLLGRVDWRLLGQREVVFAYRLAMPLPEYVLLFRVPEDRIGAQVAGAKDMLEGFAEMVGHAASVETIERRAGALTVFSVAPAPVQIAVGAVGDVMVLATSTRLASNSMRMLSRGDGRGSIALTERFQASLEKLPNATEDTTFVDLHGILGFVGGALQLTASQIPDHPRTAGARTTVALLAAIVSEFDVFDHMLATTVSDGTTVESSARFELQADAGKSRLFGLFARQEPWRDWHRMVPADATSFWFDTGVDPAALLDWIIALVEENTDGHDRLIAMGARLREIVAHVSGELACITFPQGGSTACICFLRLEKTDGVSDWLRARLDDCARYLESRGQEMRVDSRGGMHEIRLAAFPWMRPVVGVRGDNLIFASSRAAVAKVARVQSGQEPNIRSNERFARLGVGVDDTVEYLEYAQVDESAEGFANLVSAAGFFLSLLPEDRDTAGAIKLGAVLTKLAPALRELDMRYDQGTEGVTSSETVFSIRSVYRYR